MESSTFSVRMEKDLKEEFEKTCNSFGINMSAAINLFATAVVYQKKIPFEITSPDAINDYRNNVAELRKISRTRFPGGLSIDEINEEIEQARSAKR